MNAPVKWIETRRENMSSTIHGRDQIGDYEVAVKNDGTLLAIKARTIADIGSYPQLLTPAIPTLTGLMLTGCYKFKAMRMDVTGVYTNKMSTDAYRGAGRPEATYMIERMADIVANELRLDPIHVRRMNFPKPSEFPFNTACGLVYDSGNYEGALDEGAARWRTGTRCSTTRASARKRGKLFGVGVSTYVEICAIGPSKAMSAGGWEWGCVRIEFSGKASVITGATPHGQGQETSFAQIAADRLGMPMEDIVVLHGDTSVAHYGRDTYGSRATVLGGTRDRHVHRQDPRQGARAGRAPARGEARRRRRSTDGRFSAGGKSLGWGDLAAAAYVAKNLPPGRRAGPRGLDASSSRRTSPSRSAPTSSRSRSIATPARSAS